MIDFEIPGRMISGSKSAYHMAHPEGKPVFNANVCIKSRGKIWFGDLDLSADGADLQALAEKLGETVYVLREHDARFDTEHAPAYEFAVAQYEPASLPK